VLASGRRECLPRPVLGMRLAPTRRSLATSRGNERPPVLPYARLVIPAIIAVVASSARHRVYIWTGPTRGRFLGALGITISPVGCWGGQGAQQWPGHRAALCRHAAPHRTRSSRANHTGGHSEQRKESFLRWTGPAIERMPRFPRHDGMEGSRRREELRSRGWRSGGLPAPRRAPGSAGRVCGGVACLGTGGACRPAPAAINARTRR
jgi:hypothetical protein